jgi:hypothetical protein
MNQHAAAVTLDGAPRRAPLALVLSLVAHALVISLSAVTRLDRDREQEQAQERDEAQPSDRWVGSTFLLPGEPGASLVEVETAPERTPGDAERAPPPSGADEREPTQPEPSATLTPSAATASAAPSARPAPSAPSAPSARPASAPSARPAPSTRPAPSEPTTRGPTPARSSEPAPGPAGPKSAPSPAPRVGGEAGEAGQNAPSGAEGEEERQKRDLGRAFARALPIANQADAAWGSEATGRLGPIRVSFEIDAEGTITGHTVSTPGAPARLVELVKRTTILVQRGVFAVRGTMKAGREVLELSAEVLDVPVEVEGGGASVEHRWKGDKGLAAFTQTSGRRVVVTLERVTP